MTNFEIVSKKLSKIYSDFETKTEIHDGAEYFVIVNPSGGEDISVGVEYELIFYFSFHHVHIEDIGRFESFDDEINCLMKYIDEFIEGKRVVVGFFCGENALLWGDTLQKDLDMSTGNSLLKSFSSEDSAIYKSILKDYTGLECRCLVRGWSSEQNKEIDFTL